MGCHLIALGSAGQKVLEAVTYACACDSLFSLDDDLRRVPLSSLSVLTADTDAADAADTAARYQALQSVFSAAALPRGGFHTVLRHEHLAVTEDQRPSLQSLAAGRDEMLLQALFVKERLQLDARSGLQGHADAGMAFFADALTRLSQQMAQGEAPPFFARIRDELDAGEEVKILLTGSVYGGTGASGIPSVARFLRGQFASERLCLGAAVLLPPHDPRQADTLNARAAATLYSYGKGGIMRHGVYDKTGMLDAAYLVRIPGNLYAQNYTQSVPGTQDGCHLEHWLAVKCASQFYSTPFRGEDAEALGLYHIPRSSHQPSWPCFDDDRAYYRIRFGGLLRLSALQLSECHAPLMAALRGKARLPQYAQPYFKHVKKYSADQRDTLEALFEELHHFLTLFVQCMGQVQRVLPPPVPGKTEPDSFFAPQALQDLLSLLAPADDAATRRRQVQSALPSIVSGGADSSFTLKHMLSALGKGAKPHAGTPAAAFSAYVAALLGCTTQSAAGLQAAQLPPPDSMGFDPNHRLIILARSLPLSDTAPYCDAPDVLAWETRLATALSLPYQQSKTLTEVIHWRALVAMLLLWDSWELRHDLPVLHCGPPPEGTGTRAVIAALTKAQLSFGLKLFTLEKDVDGVLFEGALGLLSQQTALLPAADAHKLHGLIPACVRWYDPKTQQFSDPCEHLNETDRARLIHRLQCLQALTERPELQSPLLQSGALYNAAGAFLSDLQNKQDFWPERFEKDDQRAIHDLYIRTLAVFGPPIEGLERQEEELSLMDLKQNPLMQHLLGEPEGAQRTLSNAAVFETEPLTTYLYMGVPFAVDSQRYLLTPVNAEGEKEALLALEIAILGTTTADMHRQTARRLLALANRLTSRAGASKKAVSLLRAWSVKHSKMAAE